MTRRELALGCHRELVREGAFDRAREVLTGLRVGNLSHAEVHVSLHAVDREMSHHARCWAVRRAINRHRG